MEILEPIKSEVKPNLTPRLDFHFLNPETFAMIRIWNFNRNRVHANRGVKDIVIELDKKVINKLFLKGRPITSKISETINCRRTPQTYRL